jgi:hypothetical protein
LLSHHRARSAASANSTTAARASTRRIAPKTKVVGLYSGELPISSCNLKGFVALHNGKSRTANNQASGNMNFKNYLRWQAGRAFSIFNFFQSVR